MTGIGAINLSTANLTERIAIVIISPNSIQIKIAATIVEITGIYANTYLSLPANLLNLPNTTANPPPWYSQLALTRDNIWFGSASSAV